MTKHKCDADCWAIIVRYGPQEGCDEFAARAAADQREAEDHAYAVWGAREDGNSHE